MQTEVLCWIAAESWLERLTKRFYVGDGKHQNNLTELSIPTQRTHGIAERALCCWVGCFRHPALRVSFWPNERVVRGCHQWGTLVVNEIVKIQRSNLVFGMPVLEPVIGGDSVQIVRVPADSNFTVPSAWTANTSIRTSLLSSLPGGSYVLSLVKNSINNLRWKSVLRKTS